jgi:hypothetical protein
VIACYACHVRRLPPVDGDRDDRRGSGAPVP